MNIQGVARYVQNAPPVPFHQNQKLAAWRLTWSVYLRTWTLWRTVKLVSQPHSRDEGNGRTSASYSWLTQQKHRYEKVSPALLGLSIALHLPLTSGRLDSWAGQVGIPTSIVTVLNEVQTEVTVCLRWGDEQWPRYRPGRRCLRLHAIEHPAIQRGHPSGYRERIRSFGEVGRRPLATVLVLVLRPSSHG